MTSSTKIDNRKKDILILEKVPTQGLELTLSLKRKYKSLHQNGANRYLFVNGTKSYKFKAKDSEIVPYSLCLGNILKNWTNGNIKKQDLMGTIMILVLIKSPLMNLVQQTFTNI